MKKDGHYVGVDERFVPEDDRYVDSTLGDEIKSDMQSVYRQAKDYVSDKDNQEKMKDVGRKGWKLAKGLGIGYLVFTALMIVIVLGIFISAAVFIFSQASKDFGGRGSITTTLERSSGIRTLEWE